MPNNHEKTELEQLEDLISKHGIKDAADYPPEERRKSAFTRSDCVVIFEISRIANAHKCPFNNEEAETLQSSAKIMNRTTKVASSIIISGTVAAFIYFVWHAIRHYGLEMLRVVTGGKA